MIVEAMQFNGENGDALETWSDGAFRYDEEENPGVDTTEGWLRANPGDWIIRGVENEFYPCRASVFEATYEPVTDV